MDAGSLVGPAIAIVAIGLGFSIEGGHLSALLQPSAALIVFGGTLGAVLLHFPGRHLVLALLALGHVLSSRRPDYHNLVVELVRLSRQTRRQGIVALENEAQQNEDPYLGRALLLIADGVNGTGLRDALGPELDRIDFEGQLPARVYEIAGGYAPTAGILGAVLGLVHVMSNLDDPGQLGGGIAVAFIATIYGVAVANLVLLPIAGKLRARHTERMTHYELITEGAVALADGINPRAMHRRLSAFIGADDVPDLYETSAGGDQRAA